MTDKPSRKALGRGLAALVPPAQSDRGPGLRNLPIEKIRPNPGQPRKQFDADELDELAASIREQGVLQPILVRQHGSGYQIVAGERRWRAAAKAGLHQIPAIVKELGDADLLKTALVENLQRADLDPLEEAEAYSRLIRDHQLTQEQVAQAVGKSRVAVTNTLRLLKLPAEVLEMLADGRLTAGHARALMTLGDTRDIIRLAKEAVSRGASVRDLEAKARLLKASATAATPKPTKSPGVRAVEEKLMRRLGTKVRLHDRKGKGRIEISYHSLDHLDELLRRIS